MKFIHATLLSLGLLLTSCRQAPESTLDLEISKGDWSDYHRSLERIAERQTAEEKVEFAKALEELKYQAMIADGQSPGMEINAALREKIAGLAVRDVLVLGHTIRLGRKRDEEKALLRSIAMNQRLRTKPGDEASATFLASTHVNQSKQLDTLRAEIAALDRRVNELSPSRTRPL